MNASILDVFRWILDIRPEALGLSDKAVLLALLRTVDPQTFSGWFTQTQVADWASMSDRNVRNILPRLASIGLITTSEKRGPKGTHVIVLRVAAVHALAAQRRNQVPDHPELRSARNDVPPEPGSGSPGTTFLPTRNQVPDHPELRSDTVAPSVAPSVAPPVAPSLEREGARGVFVGGRELPPDLQSLLPRLPAKSLRSLESAGIPDTETLLAFDAETLRYSPGIGGSLASRVVAELQRQGIELGCLSPEPSPAAQPRNPPSGSRKPTLDELYGPLRPVESSRKIIDIPLEET